MARAYDFTPAEIAAIKESYGYVCAACGCDESAIMQADHWIPGDKTQGVCLCSVCNAAKHDYRINVKALTPRETISTDSRQEYRVRESSNRAAFAEWVRQYGVKSKTLVPKRAPKFVAPW